MTTATATRSLTRPAAAWCSDLVAMAAKELRILSRYPIELAAGFVQVFVMLAILVLAALMFSPGGVGGAGSAAVAGVLVYGFIPFIFFTETLWSIGYNVRREQRQGTLEQLYLSPASRSASLVSRSVATLIWTGLLAVLSTAFMTYLVGGLPAQSLLLGGYLLAAQLAGIFGIGFAFAALTLRVREAAQTWATVLQLAYMVLCAPFYTFSALPEWMLTIARAVPLAHGVDAFRSTLMGAPSPELAPLGVEIAIVTLFGLAMPPLGLWLYRRGEETARRRGSLCEY